MDATKWQIPHGEGYREIQNEDSLQYINADLSRTLYVSLITYKNNPRGTTPDAPAPVGPVIEFDVDKYHLKGTKTKPGEVLVIVITFARKDDETFGRQLFADIH